MKWTHVKQNNSCPNLNFKKKSKTFKKNWQIKLNIRNSRKLRPHALKAVDLPRVQLSQK